MRRLVKRGVSTQREVVVIASLAFSLFVSPIDFKQQRLAIQSTHEPGRMRRLEAALSYDSDAAKDADANHGSRRAMSLRPSEAPVFSSTTRIDRC